MNPAALFNEDTEKEFGDGAFFCTEAIVARNDDPERRCRIQCTIPIIDENEIHEVWARRFQLYVGETDFGDYFVPAVGAEVMVLGRLGDTNSLFYAPLFNETHLAPSELSDDTPGLKVPANLKILAGLLAHLGAQNIDIIAELLARVQAQNIELNAGQLARVTGQTITIEGAQVTINGDGTISISGGDVTIDGDSVKIHGRTVNKVGPAI